MNLVVLGDRLLCTTTGTGTGDLTLTASSGFLLPTGEDMTYCIYDANGNWEIGSAYAGVSLNRTASTAPFASSNSGTFVNFGPGTKTVVFGLQSSQIVFCGRDPDAASWMNPRARFGGIAGGNNAIAEGGIALGENSHSAGDGISIGRDTAATAGGIVIGYSVSDIGGIRVGIDDIASSGPIALGSDPVLAGGGSGGADMLALGNRTTVHLPGGIAIGPDATVMGLRGVAIGNGAWASGTDAVAIGKAEVSRGIGYSETTNPINAGELQAQWEEVTVNKQTAAGANTTHDFSTQCACAFMIDVIGQSNDYNNTTVAVRITGAQTPSAIVGTPTVTVLGRSAAFASTVTAAVSTLGGNLRVSLTGSSTLAINWSIIARLSKHKQVV